MIPIWEVPRYKPEFNYHKGRDETSFRLKEAFVIILENLEISVFRSSSFAIQIVLFRKGKKMPVKQMKHRDIF